jgi:hypothetical protein
MRPMILRVKLLVALCLSVSVAREGSAQDREQHSFEATAKPFLVKYCYDCHSGDEPEAQFDMEELTADFSTDRTANRWVDVMHSLKFGEMPPPEEAIIRNCWRRNTATG